MKGRVSLRGALRLPLRLRSGLRLIQGKLCDEAISIIRKVEIATARLGGPRNDNLTNYVLRDTGRALRS